MFDKKSKPVVDKIKIWMDNSIANVPLKMAFGKALFSARTVAEINRLP
ncbi:MAG: IS66 family transposase [Gammaproteobacteria bacterium]|nr:IS66 family transposase [Gammaproteobacteria bacterium]